MKIRLQYSTRRRIRELIRNLKEIDEVAKSGQDLVCLDKVGWIYPISFLPIVVYANLNDIDIDCSELGDDICGYLNSICFPKGITRLDRVQKDYLPIMRLACADRNDVLGRYEDRILRNVSRRFRTPFLNSLKYLTSELESNVREHAQVEEYWIFSQYWSRTKTCELGICDTGIGYKSSYAGTPYEVTEHIDAIVNALRGKSSKTPEERGAGIPSIVRMFVEGYGGEMIIMSGDSLLYLRQGQHTAYRFRVLWPGSFIGLRFRLKGINFYKYLQ